jgi:hypothetical protein
MKRWLLFSLVLAAVNLPGQIIEATGCVHNGGDDPAWARSDFDDRKWQTDLPPIGTRYSWTRCHLDLGPLSTAASKQLNVYGFGAWELFIDGAKVATNGDIATGFARTNIFYLDPLPVNITNQGKVTIALRRWQLAWPLGAIGVRFEAGTKEAIEGANAINLIDVTINRLPALLFGVLSIFASLVMLILFQADRSRKELFWFSMVCLAIGGLRSISAPFSTFTFPQTLNLFFVLNALASTASSRFFFALAGKPFPRVFYWSWVGAVSTLCAMWLFYSFASADAYQEWVPKFRISWTIFGWVNLFAAAAAFWPLWRIRPEQRVVCALSMLWMAGAAANSMSQQSFFPAALAASARNFQAWVGSASLIAIFVVIAARYRRVALDRADLQREMLAAQEVQRLLTSSTLDTADWAEVDVAYLPAKEVGGDFYFCQQSTGGQMVVVGDVSGKGLRAAMLASVALGALRHSETASPGKLLQGLNKALHGQTGGGFVTCCAVLLRADGQIVVANAGHPAPYVDGREFEVESGLPLGVVSEATYEESVSQGTRITLVSDGVVEAENAQRQLFGFDRTREISMKPAQEMAEAAKAWGQNDDITVVTVRRLS